jgi:hypothetical protein
LRDRRRSAAALGKICKQLFTRSFENRTDLALAKHANGHATHHHLLHAGPESTPAARRTIHFIMKTPVAILAAEARAIADSTPGNSVDNQRGTLRGNGPQYVYRERPAQWSRPPPPPTPDALWIPGNWTFDGRVEAWTAGHWEIPPLNAFIYLAA